MKIEGNEKRHACLWVLASMVFRYSGIPLLFRGVSAIPLVFRCSLFRCSDGPPAGVPCSVVPYSDAPGFIVCHFSEALIIVVEHLFCRTPLNGCFCMEKLKLFVYGF